MDFFELLLSGNLGFLKNVFIVMILSSLPIGVVGSFVVVNRITYIAGAISHSVLGGIGLAIYLSVVWGINFFTPSLGAFIFAVISALVIILLSLWGHERIDTAISVVWVVGMSIGLLFAFFTPRYTDIQSYLFGNILLLSVEDVYWVLGVSVIVVLVVYMFFHQLVLVSFDKDFSKVRRVDPNIFFSILVILVSLTTLLLIKTVGVILSITLITIPPAIANMFSKKLSRIIFISVFIVLVSQFFGLWMSYEFDTPTGITVSLLLSFLYIVSFIFVKVLRILPSKT